MFSIKTAIPRHEPMKTQPTHPKETRTVAQIFNLLYRRLAACGMLATRGGLERAARRRFPIGCAKDKVPIDTRSVRRLEALRHSRLGNLRYVFVNRLDSFGGERFTVSME